MPFGAPAAVEKRAGGPFAARYEDAGENHAISRSARQIGGEQRQVDMTREIEDALRQLRQGLDE